MSERRLFGLFSGSNLTVIFCAALLAPSVLYAAVAYSPEAIIDPNTGSMAFVDGGRRVWTYDPVAGFTKNPAYALNLVDNSTSNQAYHTIYTVPAGKVLLIRSITWTDFSNTEGTTTSYYLYDNNANAIYNTEGLHVVNSFASTFDPGVVVRAGALSSAYTGAGGSHVYIQGYLIPATAVPAAATPGFAEPTPRSGEGAAPTYPQ